MSCTSLFSNCYYGFGIICDSELMLPELSRATGLPDVVIRYGTVPPKLDDSSDQAHKKSGIFYEITERQFLFDLTDLAGVRYLVEDGRKITIERHPRADEARIRLFLLGTCLSVALYQRNLVVLHGSAIQTDKGGIIFAGYSGSGKSTLAAAFHQRGYPIIADDVSVIQMSETDRPLLMPGSPWLKLWPDAAEQLQQQEQLHTRVQPHINKYWLPLSTHFASAPVVPYALFLLQPDNHDDIRIEAIHGAPKVLPLQTNTYRPQLMRDMGKDPWWFQHASTLANKLQVYRIRRPRHRFLLTELVDQIRNLLKI